jgi:hypothetical protein
VSTTAVPDRFTVLPDEYELGATVMALEEHGFSVEVVDDLDAACSGAYDGAAITVRGCHLVLVVCLVV